MSSNYICLHIVADEFKFIVEEEKKYNVMN